MKVPSEGIRVSEGIELEALIHMLAASDVEKLTLLDSLGRLLDQEQDTK